MPNNETGLSVDIREDDLCELSAEVLDTLLRDHTTGRNIVWATHDYESLGSMYDYHSEILPDLITGERGMVIRPRVLKSKEEQTDRVKDMAEVFTPSRVVKMMVDYVDIDINTLCMELTCGEAPFLVSRYDATTGEPIAISERVGMLDRKLRLVNERQLSDEDWLGQVRLAFQTTYGYEWQGDNLLLARENMLYTFVDYYEERFGAVPDITLLQDFAEIISWNLWQMDGLSYSIPREKKEEPQQTQLSLFDEVPAEEPSPFCIIKDWQKEETIKVIDIKTKQIKNQNIMKFDVIIGNPPYQEEVEGNGRSNPIYNYFMDESYKVGNKVELITPARFLFNAGQTPKDWNKKILNNEHFKVLLYEAEAVRFFSNTDIKGGIAISYYDNSQKFGAIKTYTPYSELNEILSKVRNKLNGAIKDIISSRGTYRFTNKFFQENPDASSKIGQGTGNMIASNSFECLEHIFLGNKPNDGYNYILMNGRLNNKRINRYIKLEYVIDNPYIHSFNVLIPEANGAGGISEVLSSPFVCEPNQGATDTFLSIGTFETRGEAECCLKYVKTRFARCMLGVLKATQHNPPSTWAYVPLQDFTPSSDIDWSKSIAEIDEQLFDKYGLDEQERNFIRTKVKEMA